MGRFHGMILAEERVPRLGVLVGDGLNEAGFERREKEIVHRGMDASWMPVCLRKEGTRRCIDKL